MELYFVAARVPREDWAVTAATNLEGIASLWLQQVAAQADWSQVTWDAFKAGL